MIDLLKQTDKRFPGGIQRKGCRLFTLLAIPQVYLGLPLSGEQIMEIYRAAAEDPTVMMPICWMREREHVVINAAFRALGSTDLVGRQVGRLVKGEPLFWPSVRGDSWDYQVLHWVTDYPDGHWTLGNRDGVEIEDPHDSHQAGYPINKRFIDGRLLYRVWQV
jgi:hypothetical protein